MIKVGISWDQIVQGKFKSSWNLQSAKQWRDIIKRQCIKAIRVVLFSALQKNLIKRPKMEVGA